MPVDLYPTGLSVRQACREGSFNSNTSGLAATYIQANLIVLPSRYATDFRLLCLRNPVPCPLVGESKAVGKWNELKSWMNGIAGDELAVNLDIRNDCPRYVVYRNGTLTDSTRENIMDEWSEDHVAFLIGCSYSFESALTSAGLVPAHTAHGRNVPMYRTTIPLCPAGVFTRSTYVVSLRVYRRSQLEAVRDITRPYVSTHGEPIAWDWDGADRIGIKDIQVPEWGDSPVTPEGSRFYRPSTNANANANANATNGQAAQEEDPWIPVFWGCGVTPQEAVAKAELKGTVMGHAPGHMLLLDLREDELIKKTAGTL